MNLLFHPVAQHAVDELVTGDWTLACESGAHNQGLEVRTITRDLKVFAKATLQRYRCGCLQEWATC